MAEAVWRAMREEDLRAVHSLSKRVHAGYPERPEIAAERLMLAPDWCRVLDDDGAIVGYLVAHPWRLNAPPALDTLLGLLPPDADTLYLHDIVIDPARRGRGEALAAIRDLLHRASRLYPTASLVSIDGLESFWRARGFAINDEPAIHAALASYDASARYMVRSLA